MTIILNPQAELTELNETKALQKIHPCDTAVRARILAALEAGVSQGDLARGSGVNRTIVSQYLSAEGNTYPGTIGRYERQMINWLEKRDLEFLAGIETVETSVTKLIDGLLRAVRRQRIIGKGIGGAGIGKTRGTAFVAGKDPSVMAYFVSQQTGTREAIRSGLFRMFGIRGGSKTYGSSNLAKYLELVKRVRGADVAFLFDQAHMLSLPGMHFLCELWNETRKPQLWLGTEKLLERIERDEQVASRVEFGDALAIPTDGVRPLVQHQIKSMLPEVNGEMARLTNLCEKLAFNGRFRRVEMRLGNMLYLSEKPSCKDMTWCELFDMAAEFSKDVIEN